MFAQWGLPHCAFFDKRKRGENAVNENQEKTTAEVVTLEKTQPASEFVLEMTDIEKGYTAREALKIGEAVVDGIAAGISLNYGA